MALYPQKHMEALIYAAQQGNAKAFEQLVTRFQDRVFAVALTQLGNYHQAQDATQEAFIEAHLRLRQLSTPGAFPAWLHKIVLGKCVRVLRSGKSVVSSVSLEALREAASAVRDPEAVVLETVAREILHDAMERLSEEEREALLLFAIGGYRYAEIAGIMELPLALVKKRIYTARQQLLKVDELADLRPSGRDNFGKRVREQAVRLERLRKEKAMSQSTNINTVELLGPGIENKPAIKNLYTFYRYELLPYNNYSNGLLTPPENVTEDTWVSGAWMNQFGVINGLHSATHEAGVNGEDIYWEWPNLQALLIQLNGWPAGFAIVASPPNATKGVDYRLQEFFVINKARQHGVGSAAARLLFDRLPGRWEVAYELANGPATAFWRKFIPAYTDGDFTEEMIGMGSSPDLPGYVFTRGPRPAHLIKVR
jgi:RNA polymerase sigma-70 factor (ECF subfamily)